MLPCVLEQFTTCNVIEATFIRKKELYVISLTCLSLFQVQSPSPSYENDSKYTDVPWDGPGLLDFSTRAFDPELVLPLLNV